MGYNLFEGGQNMLLITITELRKHLGKYLELSKEEDIVVKKNGIIASVLTSYIPRKEDNSSSFSLAGKYEDFDYESYLRERDEAR